MKKLLILLCLSTVVSCGIKDKFLNSSTGGLGVPKQPSEVVVFDDNGTTQNSDGLPTEIDGHKVTYSDTNTTTDIASEASPDEVETSSNWYYMILVGILLIVAFLVYRLKKQNMISE